ncbi:hypothetical protein LCGC14_1233520 [marine sediment metagenome]|uniref:Uncharacterized protein n=1 Tax=marine sediment metagenome TaxID=412755 RepID=A0A0F9PC34_9ZZZZ
MDKKYWESKEIIVHWWNFGKKTLDYRGTYKGFLENKGITVTEIGDNHFRFNISISSATVELDISAEYHKAADEAIKIFLSLLGDKAKITASQKEYSVNWR